MRGITSSTTKAICANATQRKSPITIAATTFRRLFVCSFCAFRRISASEILIGSVGCSCQIFCGSSKLNSSGIGFSFVEPALQDVLDPMNLHSNVGRRKPGDFSRRIRIHTLEIRNDDLAIDRLELLDQRGEALKGLVLAGNTFALLIGWHGLDLFDAGEFLPHSSLPNHVSGGYVVGNAVHPGSKRTSPIKMLEAAPQL